MPKRIIPLTDVRIRNAKPKSKNFKLADGGGLYLLVTPTGGKLWRMKYRFGNKEKLLAIGTYPTVGLSQVRHRREDAKKLLDEGIDPSGHTGHKKALKEARDEAINNSFETIARE